MKETDQEGKTKNSENFFYLVVVAKFNEATA